MRLQEGIAALARAGLPITGPQIKKKTGLDCKTIQRNPVAYILFCKHATHFTQLRTPKRAARRTGKRRLNKMRASLTPQPTPRDPLLEHPKRSLVARIRALEADNAELKQAVVQLALTQQEIEAQNMELHAQLVTAQRNVRNVTAEWTRHSGQKMDR